MRRHVALAVLLSFVGCASSPTPDENPLGGGGFILVAGARIPVAFPVVGPTDPGGYDGSLERCRFRDGVLPSDPAPGCDTPQRYRDRPGPPATLRERIDLFVLHYDVAVTSRRCFEILHDRRGLSVHFLLDVDGTLYQTLDLALRARHAGPANDRSIGIEIAQIGAYPDTSTIDRFYRRSDDGGLELNIPAEYEPPPGGPFRPARPDLIRGAIHGRSLVQPDYTDAQYETLALLVAALAEHFPNLPRRAPTGADGTVLARVMTEAELASFRGVVGHFHVTTAKIDPGPAFDWARVIEAE